MESANLLEKLKAATGSTSDEDFILKVKALIKSRETLKQENADLMKQLKDSEEKNISAGGLNQGELLAVKSQLDRLNGDALKTKSQIELIELENAKLKRDLERAYYEKDVVNKEVEKMNLTNLQLSSQIETLKTTHNNVGPMSDEELSQRLGRVFIDAKTCAQRIISDAEQEAILLKTRAEYANKTMNENLAASLQDIHKVKMLMAELTNGFNSKMIHVETAIEDAKGKLLY